MKKFLDKFLKIAYTNNMKVNKESETIVICGVGTSGHNTKVFQDEVGQSVDIWRINKGAAMDWSPLGLEYHWDLHKGGHFKDSTIIKGYREAHKKFTKKQIMRRSAANINGLVNHYGVEIFPNTLSILLAKAILMGYTQIVLPGADVFNFEANPAKEEAGFTFWVAYAKAKGIRTITSHYALKNPTVLNRTAWQCGKEFGECGDISEIMANFLPQVKGIYE